ncbi:cysteine proteinase [Neocallimastix californiae]|uniref:ubiquitinyl hydrolase 1 n=1 Tax=Neocallimastix californiae TaxID=1754190 RepID=A0A1Y2D8T7_9FUNG|nr:cysteine proteinase [Neocallimastix californiae]|eukprot:ORY55584.1 cysteine proteinase [Neocallimastix californiae]
MVKLKAITTKLENDKTSLVCEECQDDKTYFKDIYMCLTCAKILCGNNDDNHIESHFKSSGHCIYTHIISRTCYCFSCEEDILYDNINNSLMMDVKKAIDKFESNRKHKEMLDIRKERYLENVKKTAVYPGLKNLKHTSIVTDKLKVEEGPLTNAFVSFLKTMHGKLKEAEEKQKNGEKLFLEIFSPKELFDQIIAKWDQYKEYNQQDSHELLRHLLDGIREEQIKSLKEKHQEKQKNFIDELFEGRLINYIAYGEVYPLAEDEKNKNDFESILQEISIERTENEELSIRDCLKKFMDIDTLEGKEACQCDNCTKIRYGGGENNDPSKTKKKSKTITIEKKDGQTTIKKNKGNYGSIRESYNIDEDYTSVSYYSGLHGIKEDQKSLEDFYRKMNENNDNEDDDNNIIENDEEKEIEEEKSKDEKKKVVYRRIKKRSFIDEAPKILVLNLKRFINIDLYGHVRKSEKFVDFQPFLKLGPYLSPIRQDKDTQPFYRLYGVVVHSGFSIQSGHYFAYISRTIGDWFYASDVTIRPSSWDEVKKSRPYLLFYERVK